MPAPIWKKVIVSGSIAEFSASVYRPSTQPLQQVTTQASTTVLSGSFSGSFQGNFSIGAAEDGVYTDGLFTDFTTSTPVGTAVDRFNEILAALAPPPAPIYSTLGRTSVPGTANINRRLSFNDTSRPSTYTASMATASAIGRTTVDIGGEFTNTATRLGVQYGSLNGTTVQFNEAVTANAGTYTNYPAYAFKTAPDPATTPETYSFWLNGKKITDQVLSSNAGIINQSIGTLGTVTISPSKPAQFTTSGNELSLFRHRSASFSFINNTNSWAKGYNYMTISQSYDNTLYNANYIDWVYDDNTVALTVAAGGGGANQVNTASAYPGVTLGFVSSSNSDRWLSGIKYGTQYTLAGSSSISNFYANTYVNSNVQFNFNATRYGNASSTGVSSNDSTQFAIPNPASTSSIIEASGSILIANNTRILGEQGTLGMTVSHVNTGKTVPTITSLNIPRFLFDPYTVSPSLPNPTALAEYFKDETYRIEQNTTTISATTGFNSGSFSNNNLIIVNGAIRRPSYLTNKVGSTDLTTIAPGFAANPSSITTTGTKTYTRKFTFGANVVPKLSITITGANVEFTGTGVNKLTFKFISPSTTGYESYQEINNAAAFIQGALPSNIGSGGGSATINLNLGVLNIPANAYWGLQIESTGASWAGYISQITAAIVS